MDRRNILLGLTGAVTAPMLFRSIVAYGQSGMTLDPATYALETLQIGTLSKTVSQFALKNSQNTYVRRFAKLEISEATAVGISLTSDFTPTPPQLTDDQQQAIATLEALTGSAFDTAYIQAEIQGHQQLAGIQAEFLAADTDPTSDYVHIALIVTSFIETHLAVLKGLVPLPTTG